MVAFGQPNTWGKNVLKLNKIALCPAVLRAKKLVFVLTVLAGRTMADYPSTLPTNKTASSRGKIWVLT